MMYVDGGGGGGLGEEEEEGESWRWANIDTKCCRRRTLL